MVTSSPIRAVSSYAPPNGLPSSISRLVEGDLRQVDMVVDQVKRTDRPGLQAMLEHSLGRRGKRMRATVTLLAGRFGRRRPATLPLLAAAIELLHTVTLLHDDVVDSAPTRRGRETANSRYSNAAAVVLGDYIFVAAADIIAQAAKLDRVNVDVLRLLARAGKAISGGELEQDTSGDIPSVAEYFDRVERKTAALFAASAEAGALIARSPESHQRALQEYGRNLGIAFQIADDILDYTGDTSALGKPAGSDLAQGVLTLPAILFLRQRGPDTSLGRYVEHPERHDALELALDEIRNSDSIAASYETARSFSARAITALQDLPDLPERDALASLAEFAVERKA